MNASANAIDLAELQPFPTRARLYRKPRGQNKPILTVNADFMRPENAVTITAQEYRMLLGKLVAGKTDFLCDSDGRFYTIMAEDTLYVAPVGFRLDQKNAI